MMRRALIGANVVLLVSVGACERAAPPPKTTTAPTAATAATQAAPWYEELSLSEACARAEAEDKVVFLVMYRPTCPASAMTEQSVLKNADVREFLREETVPIRSNVDENPLLAARYQVVVLPALVFLRADGSEIERLVGTPTVDGFLSSARLYLEGWSDVALAVQEAIRAHVALAEALIARNRYSEALAEYQWALERSLDSAELLDSWVYHLLHVLHEFANLYQPAREPVREIYATARDRLRGGTGRPIDLGIVCNLNWLRGEPDRSLKLYDQARETCSDPATLARWTEMVLSDLLAAHRYEDIAGAIDIPQAVEKLFVEAARDEPQPEDYEKRRAFQDALRAHREQLRYSAVNYYQVLLGLERYAEAGELATRLLEDAGGCRVYNALAWAGYLSGHPTEANLAQAREAYKCSHGDSAAITDTLARVLAARGQRDEALRLLGDRLARTNNEPDRAVLERCWTDIEAQP